MLQPLGEVEFKISFLVHDKSRFRFLTFFENSAIMDYSSVADAVFF